MDIEVDDEEIAAAVHDEFEHMLVPSTGGEPLRWLALRRAPEGGFQFFRKRGSHRATPSLSQAIHHLTNEALRIYVAAHYDWAWFHAGAAAMGERALLMAGTRGQGKSTIVSRLCASGWEYMSDEYVAINPATLEASPFPLTPRPRRPAPNEVIGDGLKSLAKDRVDIPPGRVRRTPAPLGALVIPAFIWGAPATLSRIPAAEASVALIHRGIHYRQPGSGGIIEFAARLTTSVPCYRLSFGDGEEAAELVEAEFGAWRNPPPAEG